MTDRQIERATVYQGETQLVSWTHNDKGRKVVLNLDPHVGGDVHPFAQIKPGSRLMVVAVLIGDDERPSAVKAPAPQQAQAEPAQRHPETDRVKLAGILCNDPQFQMWLAKKFPSTPAGVTEPHDIAAERIRRVLNVRSRRDILPGTRAAEQFDRLKTSFEMDTRYPGART